MLSWLVLEVNLFLDYFDFIFFDLLLDTTTAHVLDLRIHLSTLRISLIGSQSFLLLLVICLLQKEVKLNNANLSKVLYFASNVALVLDIVFVIRGFEVDI